MKILKNEYGYKIFYEIDDFNEFNKFDDNVKIEDFKKIYYKKVCFVDENYNLFIVELDNDEFFYEYKTNCDILLLVSKNKYYEVNWNGKFMNVLKTSADEYEIEMLNKIRNNNVIYFTTQF